MPTPALNVDGSSTGMVCSALGKIASWAFGM